MLGAQQPPAQQLDQCHAIRLLVYVSWTVAAKWSGRGEVGSAELRLLLLQQPKRKISFPLSTSNFNPTKNIENKHSEPLVNQLSINKPPQLIHPSELLDQLLAAITNYWCVKTWKSAP
jgi:hypothetical protein